MGETSWMFLLVGSFAAVGAAMAVGTVAAMLRYRRTGTVPGFDSPVTVSRGKWISWWIRVAAGAAIAIYGAIQIQRSGLI
ncbi:MAG: hypothetical protein WD576_03740 [Nitriliruptoraceae bacterium]